MNSRTPMHKLLVATLLFGFAVLNTPLSAKSVEKNKKINKVFKVSAQQSLDIENKFGDVKISTWDKMEVQIDINIMVDQRNEDKAQEMLDGIQIEIKETEELLRIVTSLERDDYSNKIDGKNKMEIDYTIKMPVNMPLELDNQFGDITLDRLTSKTDIELQFGSASIGELSGTDNDLTFKFADPVVISELAGGEVNLRFSKMVIENCGSIEMDSQMSNSEIGSTNQSNMKISYGSLDLGSAEALRLNSSMSNIHIQKLEEGGEFDVQYGKLSIDQLSKNFKELTIDGKFTPILVGVESGAVFELDANTKMSKLELPSGYVVKDASEYVNNEYFKGKIGEGAEGKLPAMKISNQFGKVEIR